MKEKSNIADYIIMVLVLLIVAVLVSLIIGCVNDNTPWNAKIQTLQAYRLNFPTSYKRIINDNENSAAQEATWQQTGPFQIDFFNRIYSAPKWCWSLNSADWPDDPDFQFCCTLFIQRVYNDVKGEMEKSDLLWEPMK